MKIQKIKWNLPTFEAIRRDPALDIDGRVGRIAAASGPGFEAVTSEGATRTRGAVIAATPQAIRKNARDNTLLRNLDAGA
ncbi:hypothetical protein [Pseudoclavibacter helvolus]|uniref:hypothetical protein n=1 Tax=Pseudoclavibacter helvolus TaxID=255205 RepID=UPI003C77CE60